MLPTLRKFLLNFHTMFASKWHFYNLNGKIQMTLRLKPSHHGRRSKNNVTFHHLHSVWVFLCSSWRHRRQDGDFCFSLDSCQIISKTFCITTYGSTVHIKHKKTKWKDFKISEKMVIWRSIHFIRYFIWQIIRKDEEVWRGVLCNM